VNSGLSHGTVGGKSCPTLLFSRWFLLTVNLRLAALSRAQDNYEIGGTGPSWSIPHTPCSNSIAIFTIRRLLKTMANGLYPTNHASMKRVEITQWPLTTGSSAGLYIFASNHRRPRSWQWWGSTSGRGFARPEKMALAGGGEACRNEIGLSEAAISVDNVDLGIRPMLGTQKFGRWYWALKFPTLDRVVSRPDCEPGRCLFAQTQSSVYDFTPKSC